MTWIAFFAGVLLAASVDGRTNSGEPPVVFFAVFGTVLLCRLSGVALAMYALHLHMAAP